MRVGAHDNVGEQSAIRGECGTATTNEICVCVPGGAIRVSTDPYRYTRLDNSSVVRMCLKGVGNEQDYPMICRSAFSDRKFVVAPAHTPLKTGAPSHWWVVAASSHSSSCRSSVASAQARVAQVDRGGCRFERDERDEQGQEGDR